MGVDVLRGIAVLAVVLCHAPFSALAFGKMAAGAGADFVFPPQPWNTVLGYGEYGVHLFLVISGFCIHMKWAKRADVSKGVDFISFWKRRLVRLYPPYIVTLVAALTLTYIYNAVVLNKTGSLQARFGYESLSVFAVDMFLLLILAQNLTQASWRVNNGPFWSLALEEQLYLLYFPALQMRRRMGWVGTLAVIALVTLGWRIVGFAVFGSEVPVFWRIVGPALWLPWMLGAWAAEAYCGTAKNPLSSLQWSLLTVLMFGAGLGIGLGLHEASAVAWVIEDLTFGGGCFALVMAVTTREKGQVGAFTHRFWMAVGRIGVWSYSIYLIHLLVMTPVKHALLKLGMDPTLVFVARIVIPIAVAAVFFRYIELPWHKRARQVGRRPEASANPEPPACC